MNTDLIMMMVGCVFVLLSIVVMLWERRMKRNYRGATLAPFVAGWLFFLAGFVRIVVKQEAQAALNPMMFIIVMGMILLTTCASTISAGTGLKREEPNETGEEEVK